MLLVNMCLMLYGVWQEERRLYAVEMVTQNLNKRAVQSFSGLASYDVQLQHSTAGTDVLTTCVNDIAALLTHLVPVVAV